jgi:anti-anti-sigma factor
VFSRKIIVQWWHSQYRPRSPRPARLQTVPAENDRQQFKVSGHLDAHAVRNGVSHIEIHLAERKHCLLDLAGVNFIDSTGLAFLIRLQKKLRAADRLLILLASGKKIQRAFKSAGLQHEFLSAPDLAAAQRLLELRLQEQIKPADAARGSDLDRLIWQGDITADNASRVWARTQSHIISTRPGERIIDLSGVRFIDSTGASVMARAQTLAQRERIKLSFTNVQPAVQNVLRHARLDTLLLKSTEREPAAPARARGLALSQPG